MTGMGIVWAMAKIEYPPLWVLLLGFQSAKQTDQGVFFVLSWGVLCCLFRFATQAKE